MNGSKKELHVVMQGKGGVGKSFIASLFCQVLEKTGVGEKDFYRGYDLDPVNKTLASVEGLNSVQAFNVLGKGGAGNSATEIDQRRFDDLLEEILSKENKAKYVIFDTGATTFLSINSYFVQVDIFNLLAEEGFNSTVHCVLSGGSGLGDCLNCLGAICKTYASKNVNIVVWLNEYPFGRIAYKVKAGKEISFFETDLYKKYKNDIANVVEFEPENNVLVVEDLTNLSTKNVTFEKAIGSEEFSIMSRSRLKKLSEKFLKIASDVLMKKTNPVPQKEAS